MQPKDELDLAWDELLPPTLKLSSPKIADLDFDDETTVPCIPNPEMLARLRDR